MLKYIVKSESKPEYNVHGEFYGNRPVRALYYSKSLGKHRIYRRPMPQDKTFGLFVFKSTEGAQEMCDEINKAYNDDFKVVEYTE